MGKVTPISVRAFVRSVGSRQDGGIRFDRDFECRVYADGEFRTFVNEDEAREIKDAVDGVRLDEDPRTGRRYVSTRSRDAAQSALNSYGQWKIRTTEVVELLIIYHRESTAVFARSENGAIYPNGYEAGDGYEWADDTRKIPGHPEAFVSGLGACVQAKVTLTAPDGSVSISYRQPNDEEIGPEGRRLNLWHTFVPPGKSRWHSKDEAPSMPYSEDRAKWFADALQKTCERASLLENTFDDLATKIDAGIASI